MIDLQAPPFGFFVLTAGERPGLWVRVFCLHMALKRTSDELFSERYGHRRVFRLAGWSLSFRRVRRHG
jgi:hypothetical protein